MNRPFISILYAIVVAVFSLSASTQTLAETLVNVTVLPKEGTVKDIFLLKVTVADHKRSQLTEPVFNETKKFSIESLSTATNTQTVDGKERKQISFNFRVKPRLALKSGRHRLPAGKMDIDGAMVILGRETITIRPLNIKKAQSKTLPFSGIDIAHSVDNLQPYVGEQVTYSVEIVGDSTFLGGTLDDVELNGFWRESLGKDGEDVRNSNNLTIRSYREVIIPTSSGVRQIPRRYLTAKIRSSRHHSRKKRRSNSLFSDTLFNTWPLPGRRTTVSRRIPTDPLALTARPLPPPPSDAPDYIPVGSLRIQQSIDSKKISLGESLSLTLLISGSANLHPLELSPESNDFKVYREKVTAKSLINGKKILFQKTFTYSLVPKTTGEIPIPQISILTFDPIKEEYRTISTPRLEITVAPNKEEQNLIIRGEQLEEKRKIDSAPSETKKKVEILGEDLLPQHTGTATFLPARRISDMFILFMICVVPLLSILGRFYLTQRQKFLLDPRLLDQKRAFPKAQSKLKEIESLIPAGESSKEVAKKLKNAIIIYLSEKLLCRVDSHTPEELFDLVSNAIDNPEIAAQLKLFLRTVESALYSDTCQWNEKISSDAISKAHSLVKKIEQSVGKKEVPR